ncbi:hypothetical protein LC0644_1891 [Lacticaseibacillus paracasei NRIC 0644]|uniref:Uncharacterized protein n=1 Tax=Lacticaseibacillus paracasei NRIC 0644 TaxID=1435038 RepID=A0A0C9QC04_LACPA|nr:hypothetical protein LC0644_1891 [Lacticaseibacillus paracasei NRIC 0644]
MTNNNQALGLRHMLLTVCVFLEEVSSLTLGKVREIIAQPTKDRNGGNAKITRMLCHPKKCEAGAVSKLKIALPKNIENVYIVVYNPTFSGKNVPTKEGIKTFKCAIPMPINIVPIMIVGIVTIKRSKEPKRVSPIAIKVACFNPKFFAVIEEKLEKTTNIRIGNVVRIPNDPNGIFNVVAKGLRIKGGVVIGARIINPIMKMFEIITILFFITNNNFPLIKIYQIVRYHISIVLKKL